MARLTIILVLVALILFAAHASARRQQEEEQCQRELEDVNLRQCEQHINQRIHEDEDQEDDEENVLRMHGIKNRFSSSRNYKKKCCNELRELEDNQECMCEALQQIMRNQREQLEGKQVQKMQEELRNLPQSCGFRSPRGCNLRSRN